MDPKQLPVYAQRAKILQALSEHQVIVVESPTGSGKTTQLPIILHEAEYDQGGLIGITQPRRIAAVSVSTYIQKQLADRPEGFAAYKMRFEDHTTPDTKIKVMTDGILLQEMKADPMLSHYRVIMVDEAHERSLNIDFILGLLKRVLQARKDFKVIVSSATINAQVFSDYFENCPIVRIDTVSYPVQTIYAPPATDGDPEALILRVVDIVTHVLEERRDGDILIFLSGEKTIKDVINRLYGLTFRKKLEIIPLYGRLSKEEQDLVFPPPAKGKTKVVVATNIAETSITIDGITTIIDSGLAKINYYNPRSFTSSLVEKPVSKASANQRLGRAGRTQPGTCYRLYTREDFESRPLYTQEEIYRTDLSEVVLRMAELGIRDFTSFDFISSPGSQGIAGAVETLFLLDALTEENELSKTGQMMARFPLLPRHSRILVEGILGYPSVLEELIIATSFLTTSNPFLLPQGEEMEARRAHHSFRVAGGDFLTYLKLYYAYLESKKRSTFCERYYLDQQTMDEILNVADQLSQIVSDFGVPIGSGGPVKQYLCGISKGLIQFICIRSGRSGYRSLTADHIDIHPGSVLFRENPDYIVAGEIVKTSRTFARSVSPLEAQWLPEINPDLASALAALAKKNKQVDSRSARSQDSRKSRDTTWQVVLGGSIYQLQQLKGKKKILILPWEDAHRLAENPNYTLPPQHQALRTTLTWGRYRIMQAEKLSAVLGIAGRLNPPKDILTSANGTGDLQLYADQNRTAKQLALIGKLVPIKKKSKDLGMLALYSNGAGAYWIKPARNILQGLTESLASLDSLADELNPREHRAIIDTINSRYRWLTSLLEER
ncbi:helicase-related protein [Spirochaeta lutea]|uniref:DEAD/DEAH box helicase n=1 Tax=Spirochaeta lutea TaxID=1480694 RepID=A0A098QSA3_9SPIO|nr:ATP-dependent RNA helicase [Spirochaeta lutea]KGE70760.1 DEAD/DEAH box helicase [Spirochaeta lutea]